MKLVISIDTEEDDWGGYATTAPAVSNLEALPALHTLFTDFGVTPTYLITHAVAEDQRGASILRDLRTDGRCEIGAHCHPWNTPPLGMAEPSERNSMLCNLPDGLQRLKLEALHESIRSRVGVEARVFRGGRWAYSGSVAKHLMSLGYVVDTSVSPTVDWTPEFGPDYSSCSPQPYRFSPDDIYDECANGPMLEVPATIGFFQPGFHRANAVYQRIRRAPLCRFRLVGLLDKFGLLNRAWLSPEVSTSREMIQLADRLHKDGFPVLNMVFHSPSLRAGLTPFVRNLQEESGFWAKIREFCEYSRDAGLEPVTLSSLWSPIMQDA
jgi:peptidoglycan/xylan/chitin deacetylase (PgdA/CDA1 family)